MAIRHEPVAGTMRVTLEIDRETSFTGERLDNPSRVFVDLQQTRTLDPLRDAVIPVTAGGVQRIRVGRHPGGLTRVVLDLTGASRHSVYPLYNPYRIVIDVEVPAGEAPAALARRRSQRRPRRPHRPALCLCPSRPGPRFGHVRPRYGPRRPRKRRAPRLACRSSLLPRPPRHPLSCLSSPTTRRRLPTCRLRSRPPPQLRATTRSRANSVLASRES